MKNKYVDLIKIESLAIVATFFSLWLAVIFEDMIEHIMSYIFVLSFGILHGANDLTLLQTTKNKNKSTRIYTKILLYYILFVFCSILIFYFVPSLALVVFVLFSGYHFGEQHFISKTIRTSCKISGLYFTYGTFILFLLFSSNYIATSEIIKNITGYFVPIFIFEIGLLLSGLSTLALSLILVLRKDLKINPIKELFFLVIFFVVFKTASLLWGFSIYFIFWHSIPSLYDQIFFLHGGINKSSFRSFTIRSLPYWLISVAGLLFLLFIFRDNFEKSLAFFFSFLAAITFPHVLVIKKWNQNQN
ncbi:Brp/Blh family beta-carotene 15,15'-monooxygenase [Maribacter caenipelagi]|uniref:Probable beta-carotene 15,15'-dioxygenase n=1 Tax=Maribacter caenipelagi TaxID=1447781 RepID=A0A4R7D6L8_9FLAO|nr:Brp/Blh family beta-carotene 15,15'-dioxygenase [Maribacter caenipelagi]TDS16600.1 Brp/Blh family beta-carotene 15,15'-monooxygenase [Maribacter caenipelagi]